MINTTVLRESVSLSLM